MNSSLDFLSKKSSCSYRSVLFNLFVETTYCDSGSKPPIIASLSPNGKKLKSVPPNISKSWANAVPSFITIFFVTNIVSFKRFKSIVYL